MPGTTTARSRTSNPSRSPSRPSATLLRYSLSHWGLCLWEGSLSWGAVSLGSARDDLQIQLLPKSDTKDSTRIRSRSRSRPSATPSRYSLSLHPSVILFFTLSTGSRRYLSLNLSDTGVDQGHLRDGNTIVVRPISCASTPNV